jgi:hypothetical protein
MSFLIGPLLGLGASILGSALKGGAKTGVRRVRKDGELIMVHSGEIVVPAKLANKIRKDPKYKKSISRLPSKPQPLNKTDKSNLVKSVMKMR